MRFGEATLPSLRNYDYANPAALAARVTALEIGLTTLLAALWSSDMTAEVVEELRQAFTCDTCGQPLREGLAIYASSLCCPVHVRSECIEAVRAAISC